MTEITKLVEDLKIEAPVVIADVCIDEQDLKKTRRRVIHGIKIQDYDYSPYKAGTIIKSQGYQYKVATNPEHTSYLKLIARNEYIESVHDSITSTTISQAKLITLCTTIIKRMRTNEIALSSIVDELMTNESEDDIPLKKLRQQ